MRSRATALAIGSSKDLYLSALEHYVHALGGRIEVRAVFDEDDVLVRRAPDEDAS